MNDGRGAPRLGFFTSPPHECGYLPDRDAVTLFADPRVPQTVATYTWLSAHGFRRSGTHVYRPHCGSCNACVAVRIPVAEFEPRRLHRRTLARNAAVTVERRPARFEREHFALYERYLRARHPDSQMDPGNPGAYMSFLAAPWCDTSFYEFREGGTLLAVAVVDHLDDGLSAVYTFFAPELAPRSLGRYAILCQVEWARAAGLPWLYLGYWIESCRKMAYKREYEPLEYFRDGRWSRRSPG